MMLTAADSLIDVLSDRAERRPDALLYRFLLTGDVDGAAHELTFGEVARRARALGARLAEEASPGERAVLLYPPGLDFITAFLGCLASGTIAVPAVPPDPARLRQTLPRLRAVVADCKARVILTTSAFLQVARGLLGDAPELAACRWLATDTLEPGRADTWRRPDVSRDQVAFLQYTSGSTGSPRGVAISHGNLLANEEMIQRAFGHDEASIGVGWLPPYHDMGLIGLVLQPICYGGSVTLFSPQLFLQRPVRWLQAISRFRATTSGGPNFAYDLCERKVTDEEIAGLDLRSWRVAFNGAEPVRADTLERFAKRFAPCGFRGEAFFPCYGLAEATLFVAGRRRGPGPLARSLRTPELSQHRLVEATAQDPGARLLVSCGQPWPEAEVVIVHPERGCPVSPGEVGEIWVRGPGVARSYWDRPEESAQFTAHLPDSGEGPFLRTGDLGGLHAGELLVTGRVKDLIIIRGRNHYPGDIEATVSASSSALRPGGCAAFAIDGEEGERLVVVAEVSERAATGDLDGVTAAIRRAIAGQHEVAAEAIVLVGPRGIEKTTSGKIRRLACREAWLARQLPIVFEWRRPEPDATPAGTPAPVLAPPVLPAREVTTDRTAAARSAPMLARVIATVARVLPEVDAERLSAETAMHSLGIDSLRLVELTRHLELELQIQVPYATVADHPSLGLLSERLLALASGSPAAGPSPAPPPAPQGPLPPCARVSASDARGSALTPAAPAAGAAPAFSLLFFSSEAAERAEDPYRLVREASRFADDHGFEAVWLPERHFHSFGGLFPNPSVLAATLAVETRNVRLRAGSIVLPLHDPIRVAEEWAVVDNLSNGRVDLSFASGWDAGAFVLSPDAYADRVERTYRGIEDVRRLWAGEALLRRDGAGGQAAVRSFPRPRRSELGVWFTAARDPAQFERAGALGYNLLTALLFQSTEELAQKIALYRAARERHGHDPATGHVTLMLHTHIGPSVGEVREAVRGPFREYLRSSVDLWSRESPRLAALTSREREDVLDVAFERYFASAGLFGTPASCLERVRDLAALGVQEIACLVDFGVTADRVRDGLPFLAELRRSCAEATAPQAGPSLATPPAPGASAEVEPGLDLDSRHVLVSQPVSDVFQRAQAFDLSQRLRDEHLLPFYHEFGKIEGAYTELDGRRILMFGALDYLGLLSDARVRQAAARAALEEGPGRTGSRLHNGSTPEQRAFERKLATFLRREDALVFATGYQAQIGLVTGLMDPDSTIVLDQFAHASIYDGARIAGCRIERFRHNDWQDLDRVLARVAGRSPTLVMVEGIYSNEGDMCPLPAIRRVCAAHGARLALDDAHGLGVLGRAGRGTEEEFGMVGAVDLLSGTFSKSLASVGGWVAGPREVIEWIRYHGRSMLFSAAISPPALAAAAAALDILIAEPFRVERLRANATRWRGMLHGMGLRIGAAQACAVPIVVHDDLLCLRLAGRLLERGLYVNAVIAPSVPRGEALLRTCVRAAHQPQHLEEGLAILQEAVRDLRIPLAAHA